MACSPFFPDLLKQGLMIFEHNFLTCNVDGFPKFGGISHPGKFNGKPKFGRQSSAHLHWVTGANERNSCEITETGPDMDGKRSRWGCPCYSSCLMNIGH